MTTRSYAAHNYGIPKSLWKNESFNFYFHIRKRFRYIENAQGKKDGLIIEE